MKFFQRLVSYLILFIQVLLVFLLFFQDRMILPPWLQSVGRMHPMALHLPIGLLLMSFLLWIIRKRIEINSFKTIYIFFLQLTALAATLTALMGLFLSREGGYETSALLVHKTAGITLSFLCCGLLLLYQYFPERNRLFTVSIVASMMALLVAGDFGAMLTHGEGYVWQPLRGEEAGDEEKITDSSSLFTAAIRPVLRAKCFSCHNERKAKGQLVMVTDEKLLAGGKNGPIWIPGDPANSHIIQNIHLPLSDKKHMPPKGKAQLTAEEIELIHAWIGSGADLKKAWKDYPQNDPLKIIAAKFLNAPLPEDEEDNKYTFTAASPATIQKLNDPFLSVFPLSVHSPALQADFFVTQYFDRKKLEALTAVQDQLVILNLNNMPVTDQDIKTISKFSNLEKLSLNNTGISSKALGELKNLKLLRSLAIAGTKMDKEALNYFHLFPSLEEVYTWNSGLTQSDVSLVQSKNENIVFNTGYIADKDEILKLNVPVIKNDSFVLSGDEKITLKHYLPGTGIRFTLDGTMPDSMESPVYTAPIAINGFTILKTRATKSGWYSSDVVEHHFFKKRFTPQRVELVTAPNKEYRGKGSAALIDNKKGVAENFKDTAWLGYREKPFTARFYFEQAPAVNSIIISYGKHIAAYILPPALIEVWGGNDSSNIRLLKKVQPAAVKKEQLNIIRVEGIKIDIPGTRFKYYTVVVKNIMKLPAWHPGKGDKGWVFIDEIFFN